MNTDMHWKNISTDRLFLNLTDVTATLHSFSDSKHLLEYAIDSLLSITDASAGSVFIWDDMAKELVLRVARGPYLNRVSGARLKLREGVSGWVAEQGHSVLVKNIKEDDRFKEIDRLGRYQSASFISLPILSNNKLVGVINLTEKKDLAPFNEDDFDKVGAMAKHVAIAYENLKTEKRLWHENEELSDSVLNLKETLKQQEPLVSIGKLASNLAHELNNPLDGIRRFINLALDQVKEDSLAKEYLLKAKGGVRKSIQVIRGLLSFSSEASRTVRKTSDIQRVLEDCVTGCKQNPSYSAISFDYEASQTPHYVRDAGLVTVIQNLFENARHAMADQGSLKVRVEELEKQQLMVYITDSGNGIPEDLKPRIFEPFFTTKAKGKGTGIGLSICRDIVERSGGELSFESEQGKGTTFKIKLPYFDLMD